MPVIREYKQQTSAPGPVQQMPYNAAQFGGATGEALQHAGNAVQGVAEVVAKRLDQENTRDITAKVTKAHADLAIDLQNTIRTADPGDKQAFADYNKRVDDTLSKVGEDANTEGARAFFGEASARIKGQLAETSAHGQAELAGEKAVNDYTSTLNNISSAAAADPSSQSLQFEMHSKAIDNLVANGQLPTAEAMKLKSRGEKEIAKATIQGWANLNPDYAKKKLASGEFDSQLGAEGKIQLQGEIDQAVRAKQIDAERMRVEQERVVKKQQVSTQNDFLQAMNDGKLTAKDILMSNLEPTGGGSKEQFLNMLEKNNSSEKMLQTDGPTMINLYSRIHLPDGDPKKLTDENDLNPYFGHGLSYASLNQLREEMQGKQTEAGKYEAELKKQVIEVARGKLTKTNPMIGFRDPEGDENMSKWMSGFFQDYKERRAKGDSARELLDPSSPKYLGSSMNQFQRTGPQIMRSLVQRTKAEPSSIGIQGAEAAPAAKPRQPGESPAAYLKRIKGGG